MAASPGARQPLPATEHSFTVLACDVDSLIGTGTSTCAGQNLTQLRVFVPVGMRESSIWGTAGTVGGETGLGGRSLEKAWHAVCYSFLGNQMLPLARTNGIRVSSLVRLILLCAAVLIGSGLSGQARRAVPADQDAAALQSALDLAMARKSGTAVILEVESGRILASHRIDIAARRRALPGSTVKPFTLRALLEAQAIRPDTRFVCLRKLDLAGHRMDCSHPRTSEPMDAVSALAYSCNNYFAHFAVQLDDSALDRTFGQAGLTAATGLAANEAIGLVYRASSIEQHRLKALGAADVHVTPLGLLKAYRRLAQIRLQKTADETLNPIFAGLEASVTSGMAHAVGVEGMHVAGKTGTAGAADGNWTHAWFAGYTPAEKPEIAVVVFLERGTGATDAAPIARQIFEAFHRSRRQP